MNYCGYSGRQINSSQSQSSRSSQSEVQLTQQQRFNQILLQAEELIQKQQVDSAVNKLRLLMQKINVLKQSKKDYDKKLQLVCIYNLAAAYQKQWNLDDCIPLMEKFIALVKINLQQNLRNSGTLNNQEPSSNKNWFKLKTILIRALLQYCAVLSQIGEHRKALRTAMDITNELKTLFRRGLDECTKQIAKRESQQVKKSGIKPGKTGVDKIQFSFSVLLSARQTLQQLARMQTYNEITDSTVIQSEMRQVKSKIFFWKSNPQNNIKTLRQSFGSISEEPQQIKRTTSDRNLLGIKRNQGWIEEFTIAKVMFMSPINYLEFSDNDNLIFEFNHRNLVQKIILLSVTYFSISIQLRFLEEQQLERQKFKGQKRRQSEQKIKQLQKSQIFHLKSIEIVCKHIKQNSAFVTHLVVNYHKHYKNNLNIIEQQNSLAEYSELYDPKKINKNNSFTQEDHKQLNDNMNMLMLNTVYRKDSIYYEDSIISHREIDTRQSKQSKDSKIKQQNKEGKEILELKIIKESKQSKQQPPFFSFKKPQKKHYNETSEQRLQKSNKLGSSSSFSRPEDLGQKDKTMKKMRSSGKMITVGRMELQQLDKNDKSQKQISYKQASSRSIKDKSLSKSKNFLKNSITLKQNKSSSPIKQRASKSKHFRDLKESGQLRRDFAKKKSPEQSKALDLLKRSGSLHEFTGNGLKESGHLLSSPHTLHIKKKH